MAIKTTLATKISTDLASASNITASELRGVENDLLLNAYGDVVNDTQATTNILTADNATEKLYNLNIVKQGRYVHLQGTFTKDSVGIIELETWCSITDSEYLPDDFYYFWGYSANDTPVRFTINPSGDIILITPLGASEVVFVSTIYNTLS